MEAKELRVGNYVLYPNNEIAKVGYEIIRYIIIMNISPYKPIPLTEEILLKCGYEINFLDFKHFYKLHNLYLDANFQPIDTFITYDLKYLHELQNLYFALTNQELIINL